MQNYTKGRNTEEPWERDKLPIADLPENFLWMKVSPGSKMKILLTHAIKMFKEENTIVWSGSGSAVGKTISCSEIMKRRYKPVYQITKICYRKVKEYWKPQLEDLDELVVERDLPTIHILLSKVPLNSSEPGFQAPGSFDAFWKCELREERRRPRPRKTKPRASAEQCAEMGLEPNRRKEQKRLKNANNDKAKATASAQKDTAEGYAVDAKTK